ncbi:MAG: endolytic transglycosylase MltG [Candidatus Moranbacteria bacterium]|nr:endolytic transglycosylase MltG [Candidatus Moranbacteria bacterium]
MKKIFIILILFLIAFSTMHYMMRSSRSENIVEQTFVIEKGDDLVMVGKKLAKEDFITSKWFFYYYAWKEKLRGRIFAGEYQIDPNSSIADIAFKITEGELKVKHEESIKITFPEGWTIEKMSKRLEKNNLPAEEFKKLAKNPSEEILAEFTFIPEEKSLEGFLFPDTYIFTVDATAEEIIVKMLSNFDKKVPSDMRDDLAAEEKSLYEILIFASIVEGEVPTDADRGIVAGIFKNRLDIDMALQSDATIDYIKGEAEIKHTLADLEIDSLYNTYKYPGLPPGPINNPSLASFKAAISPEETDYMYFLNNAETGETVFSKTFDEHISNKAKNGL